MEIYKINFLFLIIFTNANENNNLNIEDAEDRFYDVIDNSSDDSSTEFFSCHREYSLPPGDEKKFFEGTTFVDINQGFNNKESDQSQPDNKTGNKEALNKNDLNLQPVNQSSNFSYSSPTSLNISRQKAQETEINNNNTVNNAVNASEKENIEEESQGLFSRTWGWIVYYIPFKNIFYYSSSTTSSASVEEKLSLETEKKNTEVKKEEDIGNQKNAEMQKSGSRIYNMFSSIITFPYYTVLKTKNYISNLSFFGYDQNKKENSADNLENKETNILNKSMNCCQTIALKTLSIIFVPIKKTYDCISYIFEDIPAPDSDYIDPNLKIDEEEEKRRKTLKRLGNEIETPDDWNCSRTLPPKMGYIKTLVWHYPTSIIMYCLDKLCFCLNLGMEGSRLLRRHFSIVVNQYHDLYKQPVEPKKIIYCVDSYNKKIINSIYVKSDENSYDGKSHDDNHHKDSKFNDFKQVEQKHKTKNTQKYRNNSDKSKNNRTIEEDNEENEENDLIHNKNRSSRFGIKKILLVFLLCGIIFFIVFLTLYKYKKISITFPK